MRFSQRKGLKVMRTLAQTDSIYEPLLNKLWNVVCLTCFDPPGIPRYANVWLSRHPRLHNFLIHLWHGYFEKSIDEIPGDWYWAYDKVKHYFFSCSWYEVYDFLEFVAKIPPQNGENKRDSFTELCNAVLTEEMSAYRFVGCEIVQITTKEEIAEVEGAMKFGGQFTPVAVHIGKALEHLADRKTPDYRNFDKGID
jgi:hypothetical protein